MRTISISLLASALCATVATSFAAPPQPPRPEGAQPPALDARQLRDVGRMSPDAVGLPPGALWIVDPQGMAAFREAFEGVYNWHRDPKRTLTGLSQLIARLPTLGEVVVEGRPILGTIEANPARLEDVLAATTRVANQNRGNRAQDEAARDADVPLELRTRRHIRRLVEARRAHHGEKRRHELASRLIDEVLTQIVAPPAGGTHALAQSVGARIQTQALLDQLVQIQRTHDRLLGLWSSFQAERLALYRDLGILPYDDWKSFYDDLTARPGAIQ